MRARNRSPSRRCRSRVAHEEGGSTSCRRSWSPRTQLRSSVQVHQTEVNVDGGASSSGSQSIRRCVGWRTSLRTVRSGVDERGEQRDAANQLGHVLQRAARRRHRRGWRAPGCTPLAARTEGVAAPTAPSLRATSGGGGELFRGTGGGGAAPRTTMSTQMSIRRWGSCRGQGPGDGARQERPKGPPLPIFFGGGGGHGEAAAAPPPRTRRCRGCRRSTWSRRRRREWRRCRSRSPRCPACTSRWSSARELLKAEVAAVRDEPGDSSGSFVPAMSVVFVRSVKFARRARSDAEMREAASPPLVTSSGPASAAARSRGNAPRSSASSSIRRSTRRRVQVGELEGILPNSMPMRANSRAGEEDDRLAQGKSASDDADCCCSRK